MHIYSVCIFTAYVYFQSVEYLIGYYGPFLIFFLRGEGGYTQASLHRQ